MKNEKMNFITSFDYCKCEIQAEKSPCPTCGKLNFTDYMKQQREELIAKAKKIKEPKTVTLVEKRRIIEKLLGLPRGTMQEVSEVFIEEAYYKMMESHDNEN